ncbi:hypothetical protein OSTOST_17101 [Ostertagia ostertagi]
MMERRQPIEAAIFLSRGRISKTLSRNIKRSIRSCVHVGLDMVKRIDESIDNEELKKEHCRRHIPSQKLQAIQHSCLSKSPNCKLY